MPKVPFVPRPQVTAPSSAKLAIAARQATAKAKQERKERRKPLVPESYVAVRATADQADKADENQGGFSVPRDIAPLCMHKGLAAFFRGIRTPPSSCHDRGFPASALWRPLSHTPSVRVLLQLGTGCPDKPFTDHADMRFVNVLLPHLSSCAAWQHQTRRFTERFDYHFSNGTIAQTLFKPQHPCMRHRVIASRPRCATYLELTRPHVEYPNALRIEQVVETKCEVASLTALDVDRVEVRHIHAFNTGAWVYRVVKLWHGDTVERAMEARQSMAPRIEVSLELLHEKHTQMHDVPYIIASCLLRIRDMLNMSVNFSKNSHFTGKVW